MDHSLTILRNIWKNTLEIENIEDNDHFFILGGDSFLASIIVLTIADTMELDITLLDLYENPTLIEFSNRLEQRRNIKNLTI